jgi:hypothetical protein
MLVRKGDAELKALKVNTDAQSLAQIARLEAERGQHYGDMQSLNLELFPLQEDLAALRSTLSQHLAQLQRLEERKARMLGTIERDHGRERIASGGLYAQYREALRSLASAAIKADLAKLAPAEEQAALEAANRLTTHRESEDLMRAAVSCYDAETYERGWKLLAGGAIALFLLFALLIVV